MYESGVPLLKYLHLPHFLYESGVALLKYLNLPHFLHESGAALFKHLHPHSPVNESLQTLHSCSLLYLTLLCKLIFFDIAFTVVKYNSFNFVHILATSINFLCIKQRKFVQKVIWVQKKSAQRRNCCIGRSTLEIAKHLGRDHRTIKKNVRQPDYSRVRNDKGKLK